MMQCSKGILPCGSAGKESACNAGDLGLIPGLGRSPGEGKGYLLQYSGLENSMDCIVHGVTQSWTRLSNFHFHSQGPPAGGMPHLCFSLLLPSSISLSAGPQARCSSPSLSRPTGHQFSQSSYPHWQDLAQALLIVGENLF